MPRLLSPPLWEHKALANQLPHVIQALPRAPDAWGDLAALPQLATLLLPGQRPRLPVAALPHLSRLTGLRALQLSVAGAAVVGGVGAVAGPGMAVTGTPPEVLWRDVAALSALTGLVHLGLHGNALPARPLSRALGALTGLRDLFVAGGFSVGPWGMQEVACNHVTAACAAAAAPEAATTASCKPDAGPSRRHVRHQPASPRSGCVVVDVEALARPDGLTALERLALPQQLLQWEVELLARHCRWWGLRRSACVVRALLFPLIVCAMKPCPPFSGRAS